MLPPPGINGDPHHVGYFGAFGREDRRVDQVFAILNRGEYRVEKLTTSRMFGEKPAIVPEIEGSAGVTGEHTFLIDGDDPLKSGFRL